MEPSSKPIRTSASIRLSVERAFAAQRAAGVHFHVEGGEEGDHGEHGGADREALADGGGGVADGVELVGDVADLGAEAAHLGDAAAVVGDRAVGVDGHHDGGAGEHADGRERDAVEAEHVVGDPADDARA